MEEIMEELEELVGELWNSERWAQIENARCYELALRDGRKGYFSLSAKDEDSWTLLLFPGQEEFFLGECCLNLPESCSVLERMEGIHSIDCILMSVDTVGAAIARLRPQRTQQECSEEELEDILEVFRLLNREKPVPAGLSKRPKPVYPAGVCPNEVLAQKIRSLPCNGKKWVAHIFMQPMPVALEEGEEPVYPYGLMLLEEKSGILFSLTLATELEDYGRFFLQGLWEAMEKEGRPKTLIAANERTKAFVKPLCSLFGMEYEKRSRCRVLNEALESYMNYFEQAAEPTIEAEEEEIPPLFAEEDEPLEDASGWNEINAILLNLVSDPASLRKLNAELLEGLLADMESGELSREKEELIRAELKRREK